MNFKLNSSKLFYEGACGSAALGRDPSRSSLAMLLATLPTMIGSMAIGLLATASLLSAPLTFAQDKQFEEIAEEVIVTGFRSALQSSIARKQASDLIAEIVTAEEIGKLPDVSIAESLARLPGLSAQRLNGRAQVISVRGLAPDFTTTLLNGRLQVSVGDNRSVEYDQYPSGLLSGATVYKTPSATLLGQGLAGTVDLQTVRPLEVGEKIISLTGRFVASETALNPDAEDRGERVNFLWIDQARDDSLGFAIGLSHFSDPSQGEHYRAWGDGGDYPEVNDNRVLGGHDSFVRSSVLERNALMVVVDYNDLAGQYNVLFDLYYSEFTDTNFLRGVESGLEWQGGDSSPQCGLDAATATTAAGFVRSGLYDNCKVLVRNDLELRETELTAVGFTYEFFNTPEWTTRLDLSYSKAEREDLVFESYSGLSAGGRGLANGAVADVTANTENAARESIFFNYGGTGESSKFTHSRDYTTAGVLDATNINKVTDTSGLFLTDVYGWGSSAAGQQQVGYYNNPTIDDELTWVSVSGEYDINTAGFENIEFGINYVERDKEKDVNEFVVDLVGNERVVGDITATSDTRTVQLGIIPASAIVGVVNLDFLGISLLGYDPRDVLSAGAYKLLPNVHPDVTEKSWRVEEEVFTFYAQVNFDIVLPGSADATLNGNFGFQYVDTDQSSNALAAAIEDSASIPDPSAPASGGASYTEFLPSANLIFSFGEHQKLRIGLARTLARSRMDDLRATEKVIYNDTNNTQDQIDAGNSPWTRETGNPELRPWIADSLDVSYEYYFADAGGYFSAAAYTKELDTYVFNAAVTYDFSAFNRDPIVPSTGAAALTIEGGSTQPRNGEGGSVDGLELALVLNGYVLAEGLRDFGISFNYSYNDSEVRSDPESRETITLPGLSRETYNITLFYENDAGFGARVSNRYRSSFIAEVQGFGAGRSFRNAESETILDAQINYNFPEDHSLSGLSFFLQGTNLTNEAFVLSNIDNRGYVARHEQYGATYLFGVGYNFY